MGTLLEVFFFGAGALTMLYVLYFIAYTTTHGRW
jgi:hypothetical protein